MWVYMYLCNAPEVRCLKRLINMVPFKAYRNPFKTNSLTEKQL